MTEGICLSVNEKAKKHWTEKTEVEILKTLIKQNGFDIAFSSDGRFAVAEGNGCSAEQIAEILQMMDHYNFDLLGAPQISFYTHFERPVRIMEMHCAMTFKKIAL